MGIITEVKRTGHGAGTSTPLAENIQRGQLLQAQLDLLTAELAAKNGHPQQCV